MALHISNPEPGFYRVRLCKGGVWVPLLVFRPCPMDPDFGYPMSRHYPLQGQLRGTDMRWGELERLWPYVHPIDQKEFAYLLRVAQWADQHDPGSPEANPRRPVDLGSMPPIF